MSIASGYQQSGNGCAVWGGGGLLEERVEGGQHLSIAPSRIQLPGWPQGIDVCVCMCVCVCEGGTADEVGIAIFLLWWGSTIQCV